jgi:hypothetical protein|tara:strand:- start:171 stop:314 length:144 start_codon:yes stop_codon:yes gene_type:complete
VSPWLIIVTGLIYLTISVEQLAKGQPGLGVMYLGYALGNVGLYMVTT